MAGKTIYLVRHGQTDFNLKGIVQGKGINASLNAHGQAQANAFYNAYCHIAFDAVHTSVLKRSIESVSSFIDSGIPHYTWQGLNEIDWGNREGQQMVEAEKAYYQNLTRQWREGKTTVCIEGGESPLQVAERQQVFINAMQREEKEKTILICMHGRAMRILLCQLLHYPIANMDIFPHHNTGLYLLHYTGSMYTVEKFNDTGHLSALKPTR